MGSNEKPTRDDIEKQKKADERNEKLIYMREELDKKAVRIARDRAMHRERREKEALLKGTPDKLDPLVRRNKDFVKNEYGIIDEVKDEQTRQEKMRQNLMNSPEIQDLQKQLQVAYVRKQLQAQFDEKKLDKIKSSQSVGTDFEEIQRVAKSEADNQAALQVKESQKKLEYRKLLQDQIINKYKLKQEEYRVFLKERALLEDAMRCVMEEDEMEEFRKRRMREKVRQEIEDFRNARALWTLREKQAQEQEELNIKAYNKMKTKLEDDIKDMEKKKREELQRKRTVVSAIMSQKQDTRDEQEQSILDKYQEEQERKAREKEQDDFLKDKNIKKDLSESFARQAEDKQERMRIQKQEERDYIMQKLAEYREDKKCEEMTAAKRKRLKMAYKSQILREIEEKKYRQRLEEQEDIEIRKTQEEANKERKKIINEERLRILNQHTGQLIGYLPPNFLKPTDLPFLPQQVSNYYTSNNQLQSK